MTENTQNIRNTENTQNTQNTQKIWLVYTDDGQFVEACKTDPSNKDMFSHHFYCCEKNHDWGNRCKYYCKNLKIYMFQPSFQPSFQTTFQPSIEEQFINIKIV